MIKAIETKYKGYRFRSRLEARWAVLLDAMGIRWDYELEGYELDELGWYLPDFYLPDFNCWIEIKGQEPSDEDINKCKRLSKKLYGDDVFTDLISVCHPGMSAEVAEENEKTTGQKPRDMIRNKINKSGKVYLFRGLADDGFFTTSTFAIQVAVKNVLESFMLFADNPRPINVKIEGDWHPRKVFPAALDKARSARFEHGETPQ